MCRRRPRVEDSRHCKTHKRLIFLRGRQSIGMAPPRDQAAAPGPSLLAPAPGAAQAAVRVARLRLRPQQPRSPSDAETPPGHGEKAAQLPPAVPASAPPPSPPAPEPVTAEEVDAWAGHDRSGSGARACAGGAAAAAVGVAAIMLLSPLVALLPLYAERHCGGTLAVRPPHISSI